MTRIYGGLWHISSPRLVEIFADDGFGNLVECPVAPMIEWIREDTTEWKFWLPHIY